MLHPGKLLQRTLQVVFCLLQISAPTARLGIVNDSIFREDIIQRRKVSIINRQAVTREKVLTYIPQLAS